ncbi:MAG TPA: hypothetical protein VII47_14935 [Actinomycetota bacterium]
MRTNMLAGNDRRWRWALVVAVVPGLWLAPATSRAQNRRIEPTLFATLTLYEVQEGTDLRGQSPVVRLANAALVGKATGPICAATAVPGSPPQDPCDFDTRATSNVPLDRGIGQLQGDFELLFDSMMNPGHLLSDLIQVAKGTVHGTLDLRPILTQTGAVAYIRDGTWRSRTLGAKGTFTGTFFVPVFTVPTDPADPDPCPETHFAYFDPNGGFECLAANQFSLERPVTKVVATFMKTGTIGPGDDDDHDGHGNH